MKHHICNPFIFLFFFLFVFHNVFCQDLKTTGPLEYVVNTTKINFHYQDSILPFTLFTDSDESFYFRPGFVSKPDSGSGSRYRFIKDKSFREVYSPMTDSIVNIDCLFPRLISHDSAFLDKSPSSFIEWDVFPFAYELEYSYILKSLKESSLYNCLDKRAIRIIFSLANNSYTSIRLEITSKETTLIFSDCEIAANGIFKLRSNRTYLIKEKYLSRIEQTLNSFDFGKERYFSQLDLSSVDPNPRVIIEFRNGENYYIVQKPMNDKISKKLVRDLFNLINNGKKIS